MLKYTYKQVLTDEFELNSQILKRRELARGFVYLKMATIAIYRAYIESQNPTGSETELNFINILNNNKYKNIILSNSNAEGNKQVEFNIFDCFEALDSNLKYILKLTDFTEDEKIVLFCCIKPYEFFKGTAGVIDEQLEELHERRWCPRYYLSLYDDNDLVITIFVFLFKKYKQQVHFFIVKELYYSLNKYIQGQPEIKNSSILLHSFAAYIFNSDIFCTFPLASMVEIFKRNNINTIDPKSPEEAKLWSDIWIEHYGCVPDMPLTHYYSTADIKIKWLENIPFENINKEIMGDTHIFFVPKILKGGYKQLAYKYKNKYLKLKQLLN